MTDVDVIVLDIDGGPMLDECLASIRAQSVPPTRIIVFDNGSRVPVCVDAEVIRSETNRGFAGGANAAFRETTAPYVALVNNDVVLHADWLAAVVEALDRDPQLAAVQTINRRPDGRIDGAGIDISDGTFRQIGHGQTVGEPLAVAWGVSGTAALYRRTAIAAETTPHPPSAPSPLTRGEGRSIDGSREPAALLPLSPPQPHRGGERVAEGRVRGGAETYVITFFDERFFAYYEDVELCARLRKAGWRIAVLPVVRATHRGSSSAGALGRDALRLRTRNRYYVARLHRGVGRIRALLWEDARLALRRRTSLRGVIQGLWTTL